MIGSVPASGVASSWSGAVTRDHLSMTSTSPVAGSPVPSVACPLNRPLPYHCQAFEFGVKLSATVDPAPAYGLVIRKRLSVASYSKTALDSAIFSWASNAAATAARSAKVLDLKSPVMSWTSAGPPGGVNVMRNVHGFRPPTL